MATNNGMVTDLAATEPSDFGVLSPAVQVVEDGSLNWSSGIDFPSVNCGTNIRLSAICSAASGVDVVEAEDGALYRRYLPFAIETTFKCSTFGIDARDDWQIARTFMEAAQQKAIEYELWTGELSKQQAALWGDPAQHNGESFPNRWLASSGAKDVTPTPGTAVKAKFGLALLEDALGDCGAGIKGTIHATRGVASALGLKDKNGALRTTLGNSVIAGAGYDGRGPTGAQPPGTSVWLYATGPVSVRLGDIVSTPDRRNQAVDIRNNAVQVYASRPAAVTWDSCCHFAVLVDLSLDYS